MSDRKLTDLTEITTPSDSDYIYLVDVSDTTNGASGTSKKALLSNARGWPQTAAESAAGVTPTNLEFSPGDVRRYGTNTTPGTTDMSTALQAAIDQNAQGGNKVVLPPEDMACGTTLKVYTDTHIEGNGWKSHIILNGVKIHVDGPTEAALISGWKLEDFQCSRIGTAGPVIHIEGDDAGGDPIRWCIDHVWISASTGDGIHIESSYIGDIISPLIQGCTGDGVQMNNAIDVAGNDIKFHGGEIQANGVGVRLNDCNGISFFGTDIEGNTNGGVDIERRCRSTAFFNCWFEQNGNFDIRVGNDATSPRQSQGLTVHGGTFTDAASAKDHGIILLSCDGVDIQGGSHSGYGVSFVANDQVSNGAVRGSIGYMVSTDGAANLDTPNGYIYERQYSGEYKYNIRTGAGAISLDYPITLLVTTGTDALTLADGYEGQKLHIAMVTYGGVGTLTPDGLAGATTITFNGVGDTADLIFISGNWHFFGGTATLNSTYETVTTTNVIAASESGKTFYLNAAGGFTSTLPAPAAGLKYTFIVKTAPTTAYVIATDSGSNVLYGTYLDIVGELTYFSAQDTLNFVANTSLVGDRLEVESDGTNWYCKAFSGADGGITVSAT